MTKRRIKEDLKKPDFMMVALERVTTLIKEHLKVCIIGVSALVVIAAALTGYRMYETRENDKLQYQLEEGIAAYQEYTINGSGQSLQKAESLFKNVSASRQKDLDEIAKLYLAKICYAQGKRNEATSLYSDVKNRASNTILKKLAETALQHISQPVK